MNRTSASGLLVAFVLVSCAQVANLGENAASRAGSQGEDPGANAQGGTVTAGPWATGSFAGGSFASGSSAGGSSSAGSSADDPSAGAPADAASADAGGADPTCGGELKGQWASDTNGPPPFAPPVVDDCWDLTLTETELTLNGTERGARSRYSYPEGRRVVLTMNPEGQFIFAQELSGPVTQSYAAKCLAIAQPPLTCDELGVALTDSGSAEGPYQSIHCTPDSAGGCSCLIQVGSLTSSFVGAWTATGDGHVELSAGPGALDAYSQRVGYCTTGGDLRFTADIDEVFRYVSGLTFHKMDCEDGVLGPGEEGIDCSIFCPKSCP